MNNEIPDFFREKDILGLDKPIIKVDSNVTLPDTVPNDVVVYATLGTRIIAYILDIVILLIPLFIIEGILLGPDFRNPEYFFRRYLIDLVVWTAYYGLWESSERQATLGKRICGLVVIDGFGDRLTFKKAIFRFLAQIISIVPLGLGIWAIAVNKKKQAWHDTLLNCYVIKGKPTVTKANINNK